MGRAVLTRSATEPRPLREISGGEPADDVLVSRVRAGEDRAFELLFERHHRAVAAYVRGLLRDHGRAEDITQEVFLSALRRMRQTDRPIAFRPWVHEIARNACIDEFRRVRRKPEVSIEAAGEGVGADAPGRLAGQGVSADAAVDQRQAMRDLWGAFDGLSDIHHRVLVLRELAGLSYREIGEELGMTGSAVESTVFRARRRLSAEYRDLASGESCARAQALMETAAYDRLGKRDGRHLSRHLEHCPYCRMKARVAGVDTASLPRPVRPRSLAERIGALLPFPAFLRDRLPGGTEAATSGAGGPGQALMAHLPAIGPVSEPLATGWGKAAAAVAALTLAGAGAGVGTHVASKDSQTRRASPSPEAAAGKAVRAPGVAASSAPSAGMQNAAAAGGAASSAGRGTRDPARATLIGPAAAGTVVAGDRAAGVPGLSPRVTEAPAGTAPPVVAAPQDSGPAPRVPEATRTPGAAAPKTPSGSSGKGPKAVVPKVPAITDPSGKGGKGKGGEGKESGGKGESGKGTSGKGESGKGTSGKGPSGKGEGGKGTSGKGPSGKGEGGNGPSGKGEGGKGPSGKGEGGQGESGKGSAGKGGEPGGRTPEVKLPDGKGSKDEPAQAPEVEVPRLDPPKLPDGKGPKGPKDPVPTVPGGVPQMPLPSASPSPTASAVPTASPSASPVPTMSPVPSVTPVPSLTPVPPGPG